MRDDPAIAILGGGVSGLTLARALVDRGATRVVVFEREAEVGGKVCTVAIDGRPHDLGATMGVPIDYRRVVGFSREAGIATVPFPRETHYSLATGTPRALNRRRELPAVLAQAGKYLALHAGAWRGVDGSGLHLAPAALHEPWATVAAQHGLADVSRRTLCYRAGYGYGFDDEIPAVLYANLLRPQTLLGLAVGDAFMWQGGTQPIWTELAARLAGRVEIRRATPVSKVVRSSAGVAVHSVDSRTRRAQVERFDRLVITFNPKDALPLLDASPAEQRWFGQVETYPYATFACEVDGLDEGRASVGYLDDNMRRDRPGHPMAWVKRYPDQNVFVCHLFAPPELDDAAIQRRIGDDLARLGGRLRGVRAARRWAFFPHFRSPFMRAGGLAEIARWQGQHRTFLVGEVLSFASLARVTEHAMSFAERVAAAPARPTVAVPGLAS